MSITTPRPSGASRLRTVWGGLSHHERRSVVGMTATVLVLTVIGWGGTFLLAPRHYSLGSAGTFSIGLALTAYTLGMRHAFDADHIAAIDNTTRRLMGTGRRPLSVGFWFSLGHSTIVFALAVLLSLGVRALIGPVRDESSSLHEYTGLIGTLVSGGFLYVIAGLNLVALWGIWKVVGPLRKGELDEAELERRLEQRGLLNRVFGKATRAVRSPWQMYPLGVLFGLGFDTATEVALLVIASAGAFSAVPWYVILTLPILFAAGMSLFDAADGVFMSVAYEWAFARPARKVYYNLTITGLSVMVALVIGTIELGGLLAQKVGLTGPFWSAFEELDLNTAGFAIVGLFVLVWVGALAYWKLGRVEEKWAARAVAGGPAREPGSGRGSGSRGA